MFTTSLYFQLLAGLCHQTCAEMSLELELKVKGYSSRQPPIIFHTKFNDIVIAEHYQPFRKEKYGVFDRTPQDQTCRVGAALASHRSNNISFGSWMPRTIFQFTVEETPDSPEGKKNATIVETEIWTNPQRMIKNAQTCAFWTYVTHRCSCFAPSISEILFIKNVFLPY